MIRPITRLRLAARAARRRRYGYAALRVLRRGMAAAFADHIQRSIADEPYADESREIFQLYKRELGGLLKRFVRLQLDDERSKP